ncbi:VWA domain-containing protein BatB [Leptospira bouyouniensis]|uniref:VWA domain-containing protein n=1 Tax=Leptospira bouyouniensis TaxID=2484911 RepID=A0ABY2L587_9LEPT|nr:VWA domain-containing protein [Leptospira bouyouniensis]TGK49690.1 VWA domain-containing protein [Leptospira bouyouniensis]
MEPNTVLYFGTFTISLGILVSAIKLFINYKAIKFSKRNPGFITRLTTSNQLLLLIRTIAIIVALLLVLTSLYKTKSIDIETTKEFESTDILFVVDVSLSMNAIDVRPNRLKRFQDLTLRLLPELKGNRIGIIVFAGQSFSFCPMTSDITAVSDYIQSLGVEMVGTKGTNLAVALERVEKIRKKNQNLQSNITVIVSDGEDHEKQTLPELQGEVMVWGLGTVEGGPIEFRDPSTGKGGFVTYDSNLADSPYSDNLIITKLNEELLESIATKYNGNYHNISFYADGAYSLVERIDTMKKNKMQRLEKFKQEDGAHPFLLLSLLFLAIERILSYQLQKSSPIKVFFVLFCFFSYNHYLEAWELDPGGNAIERGNKFYQQENFKESQKEFSEAKEYIKDDPRLMYNESANEYKLGRLKESKELSEKILTHPKSNAELKSKANLTLGNIYTKLGQKENALKSYVESLKHNPNQTAAKKNIEHLTKKQNSNQNQTNNRDQKSDEHQSQKPSEQNKEKNQNSKQNQTDIDRIMEPFSQDSILKNKRGGSIDNEKFW